MRNIHKPLWKFIEPVDGCGQSDLRGWLAEGIGGVWNLSSVPRADGAVCLAHSHIPSWMPGVSVPTRADAGRASVGPLLSDCGSGRGGADGRSQGWGIKASEELGFCCQRRKEE